MAIITLTTDLGTEDHYVGVLKGSILKHCPDATIIDISHKIPPYDILKAAYTLKNCFKDFPEGTIHIIGVNPEISTEAINLVILYKGQYFIGSDNGVFSLIFEDVPEKMIEISIMADPDAITFPTKDIFTKAACHIAKGGTLEMIGMPTTELNEKALFRAVSVGNIIKGMAIHIDHYGNIITNIDDTFFKAFGQGREFKIEFRRGDYDINSISKVYSDVPEGEKLAIFSSSRMLEIAMNKGNASKLLGMKESDIVRIEFYDR
ncbi:MAG: SAM-dependent chlorinase/fluorinase [Flavobacteriales bacterium]|nr:SAM-dependent chlorinase/fluorinase [Flavobacteriales bacterium]